MDMTVLTNTFGPWHWRVFIAVFYFNIVGVWQNYGIVFLAANPKYHCIEPYEGLNETCHVSNGSNVVPCTKWKYEGPNSIISQWDLVCDREWLVSMSKSIYMIAFLISVSVFGQLSDIFGRFPVMCVGYFITTVSSFMTLLSTSYTMFLVLRFFHAFGRSGTSITSYVLMLEVAGPKYRTSAGIAFQLSWNLGACTLPGIAWIFQDWFWLQLVFSIAFLPCVLSYGIVPESPRWLLMKGKHEQLKRTIKKVATINKVKNDDFRIEDLKDAAKAEKEKEKNRKAETVWDLYRSPQLRKRILILYYIWPAIFFMYYSLLYNTNDLSGNLYLNFFVSATLELVAFAAVYWGIRTLGRRLTLSLLFLGGAVTSVARVAFSKDIFLLQISLWMATKLCAKSAFTVLYLYTSELFPTVVRNVAVGSCSSSARFGSVLSPFVKELGKATYAWVPTVLNGSLCFVGGLLALLLPETKNRDMPDTLQQGEDMR